MNESYVAKKFAAVAFPTCAADITGATGTMRVNSISAAGSKAIPSGLQGKFWRVRVVGGDCQLGVSVGAKTLVANQASEPGTGSDVSGSTVLAAEPPIEGIVPSVYTHFNYVPLAGATISIEIIASELPDSMKGKATP